MLLSVGQDWQQVEVLGPNGGRHALATLSFWACRAINPLAHGMSEGTAFGRLDPLGAGPIDPADRRIYCAQLPVVGPAKLHDSLLAA